ncbi:hypothetical protein F1C10_07880 [Sphingomonas sp. NBWT7]|uniref:hypothetical protein n=1 Tax=Sphingomonas sp. NBWT7 TaxID=2596913 RepID=UPI00162ADF9A|nr:hypothetical protein [Sphingomonas sp. NBWT7]QNE31859.1 hypothetical protein F1C10_07880 [Sphingomonas sp. NBWT7]
METDSLRMLRQRRADLSGRLEAVRTTMRGIEKELRQIEAGIAAMTSDPIAASGNDASERSAAYHARLAHPDAQHMTMKQMIVRALAERFANGATANELLVHFRQEWGRLDIARTSLSPQLSRLKEAERIRLEGRVWKLNEADFDALMGDELPLDEIGEAPAKPTDRDEGAATPSHPQLNSQSSTEGGGSA